MEIRPTSRARGTGRARRRARPPPGCREPKRRRRTGPGYPGPSTRYRAASARACSPWFPSDDEAAEARLAARVLAGAGEHRDAEAHVGARVGDEGFLAVEHPSARHPLRPGPQRADVRARPRLGQPEGADFPPFRERPQPPLALVVVAEEQQREAADGGMRLPGRRDRRVHCGEGLEQRHIAHRGGTDAAPLLRHQGAEQPELAQAAQQFGGTAFLVPRLCGDRGDLALRVGAAQVEQFAFELGECEVHGPLALADPTLTGQYIVERAGDHRNEQPGGIR